MLLKDREEQWFYLSGERFITGKIDSMRKYLPCKIHIKTSSKCHKLMVDFNCYPTLRSYFLTTEDSSITIPSSARNQMTDSLSIRFKLYALKTIKVKIMVKFTKHPAIQVQKVQHQTKKSEAFDHDAKKNLRLKDKLDLIRYSFYEKIHLEKPSKPYMPEPYKVDFVKHNIGTRGQRDAIYIRDRSREAAKNREALGNAWNNHKELLHGLELMKEYERCQKQVDQANQIKNRFLVQYYFTVQYMFKVISAMRDEIMVMF